MIHTPLPRYNRCGAEAVKACQLWGKIPVFGANLAKGLPNTPGNSLGQMSLQRGEEFTLIF
jgi:hypothetical protein